MKKMIVEAETKNKIVNKVLVIRNEHLYVLSQRGCATLKFGQLKKEGIQN